MDQPCTLGDIEFDWHSSDPLASLVDGHGVEVRNADVGVIDRASATIPASPQPPKSKPVQEFATRPSFANLDVVATQIKARHPRCIPQATIHSLEPPACAFRMVLELETATPESANFGA